MRFYEVFARKHKCWLILLQPIYRCKCVWNFNWMIALVHIIKRILKVKNTLIIISNTNVMTHGWNEKYTLFIIQMFIWWMNLLIYIDIRKRREFSYKFKWFKGQWNAMQCNQIQFIFSIFSFHCISSFTFSTRTHTQV